MNLLNIGLSQSELVILREYAPIDFPQKLKDTYNEYYTVLIALFLVLARYWYIQNDDELRIHLVTELTWIMKQIEEQFGTSREVISEALKLID